MSNKPRKRAAPRAVTPAPSFTPAPTRARHDGWTPARQLAFVDALAASGCVAEACAAVGISRQAAYALRVRPQAQAFRFAWDAALDLAVRRLADECFARAMNGVAVPHFYKGEQVGEHRRYDNRLAMFLLRYRDPLRYAATLDQMVYTGHPEAAAAAYAKAHNRLHAEAFAAGPLTEEEVADDADAGCPPYEMVERHAEEQRQADEALAASGSHVYGTGERKNRIRDIRERNHRAGEAHKRREAEQVAAERRIIELRDYARSVQLSGRGGSEGDVASTSSTSAPPST